MALNRTRKVTETFSPEQADKLADMLADKVYGEEVKKTKSMKIVNISISLPEYLAIELEDLALKNKRAGEELKSKSAIVCKQLMKLFPEE